MEAHSSDTNGGDEASKPCTQHELGCILNQSSSNNLMASIAVTAARNRSTDARAELMMLTMIDAKILSENLIQSV